jgi:hypothetical protein
MTMRASAGVIPVRVKSLQRVIRAGGIAGAANHAIKQRLGAGSVSKRERNPLYPNLQWL